MQHDQLPRTPLVRGLLGTVAFLGLVALVGLVALWPRGANDFEFDQLGLPTQRATIAAVGTPCTTVPVQPCQRLTARFDGGERAGQTTSFDFTDTVAIDVGDTIRLVATGAPEGSLTPGGVQADAFAFSDFERRSPLIWLALIFAVIVIASTRLRGLRSLVGLGVSLGLIVAFVVPSIVRGNDPLLVALVGTISITLVTFPLAYGIGIKSLSAIVATASSLLLTILLAQAATAATHLTGRSSEETYFLRVASGDLSLRGLLIAGMVIGALGVLDDLTVSQSSTVMALRKANPALGFGELFRSALTVGKDHILATVNTLFMAYAGAALPVLLIFSASDTRFSEAFNSEIVASEVVSMVVGSIGLIAAMPIATGLAAALAARLDPADLPEDDHHGHSHAH